jgi:hypothetical protein
MRKVMIATDPAGSDATLCEVNGDRLCSVADVFVLTRGVNGFGAAISNECEGYRPCSPDPSDSRELTYACPSV